MYLVSLNKQLWLFTLPPHTCHVILEVNATQISVNYNEFIFYHSLFKTLAMQINKKYVANFHVVVSLLVIYAKYFGYPSLNRYFDKSINTITKEDLESSIPPPGKFRFVLK